MKLKDFGSKAYKAITVLTDIPGAEAVDGVLTATDTHYLVLWLAPVGGTRDVVGMEMAPRKPGGITEDELATLRTEWLVPAAQRLARLMPKDARPITQPPLRAIPLRAAQTLRSEELLAREVLAHPSLEEALETSNEGLAGFTPREIQRLGMLQDALDYAHAVQAGLSPTAFVAVRRGITRASAEQRINRARLVGFLTPSESNKPSGELTKDAKRLHGRVRKRIGSSDTGTVD